MGDTADSSPYIETIRFDRAQDLLAALRPSAEFWGPDPTRWVFRGHGDASWRLLPSVNRRRSLLGFLDDPGQLPGEGPYCIPTMGQALLLLKNFALALDSAGREIPGGQDVIATLTKNHVLSVFSHHLEPLAALGQHHGLPTRLLDWTRIGTYACYFAAAEAADNEAPDRDLDIWALNTTIAGRFGIIREEPLHVRLVTPPRAGNANLHAQGGVFTISGPQMSDTDGRHRLDLIAVDEIVRAAAERAKLPGIMMRRLSLPRREARALLRWLSYEGVTGASLFTGLDGVVRSVREARGGELGHHREE